MDQIAASVEAPASARAEVPFVELRGIAKEYPGVVAVDDVDLAFDGHHVVGLVGKNGAGKSTLIKMMAGAIRPDRGQILVDGTVVELHGPRDAASARLAFVHQDLHDVPGLTVAENVMLGLGFPRRGPLVDWSRLRRKAADVLHRLEVDIDPKAVVADLSIAQRRMVVLAHGLAQNARMVVLDEPTASLSDEEINHLFAVIRRLRVAEVGVVYVSHRLDEIFALTERVVVMRDAHVVGDVPTAELDRSSLIALITGHDDARTAVERRHDRGIGGRPDSDIVLSVRGVSASERVFDCSFDLHRGEILGIAGLVGAGRTELVRAVFGADRRTAGTIEVNGRPVDVRSPEAAMAAGMALLPEDRKTQGNVMDFSVRHNITLASLPSHRVTPHVAAPSAQSERRGVANDLIGRLSIKTPNDRQTVRLLSGGNQQKVVIAKWLAQGADLLFFDEPTHGVDVDGKEEIYRIVEDLAAAGKSVVFISSEFSELVGLCHRVVVMREGRLGGELDGDEISERAIVAMCYGGHGDAVAAGAGADEDVAS